MSAVMEYSPMSVGTAYLPFCAVLVAALAASAPLVSRHRVPAHDADALDLVPAMLPVALGLELGPPGPGGHRAARQRSR